MKFTRRQLIGAGVAGIAGCAGAASVTEKGSKEPARRAKNIIFCVADGMSAATLSMTDQFQQMTTGKSSYWASLMEQEGVVNGLQETRSLNSVVTDSSAASSTWGCGRRIWNGHLNIYPDGTELRTLRDLMHSVGTRVGLVTTTTVTHATPAGFAVSCINRGLEGQIAEKYLKGEVDVLMGGGDRFFSPTTRADKRDMYAEFEKAGYKVIRSRSEVASVKHPKILGVFSSSHLPFSIDRANSENLTAKVPTLAEMATAALANLKDSPKGFLLQIEGGKVDHAGHADDLAGMIYDQIAFEEAVKVAVDFALKDGNTLVVVTADHATGGPGLNGAGDEYIESTGGLKRLAGMKSSYGPIFADLGSSPSQARVKEVIDGKLGIQLTNEEADLLISALERKWAAGLSEFDRSVSSVLGIVLGNHTKVQWTSLNHTSDHVIVTALGPGSEVLNGLTKNMHMFDIILAQKGLKWSNPTMSFEEAAKHYEKLKDKGLVAAHGVEDSAFWV